MQIVLGQIGIAEDLQQEAGAEDFSGVHGNNGATTVGMTKKMMTAFYLNHLEIVILEDLDNLPALEFAQFGHQTAMRCTPTKSEVSKPASSTSRQSSIASRTRLVN